MRYLLPVAIIVALVALVAVRRGDRDGTTASRPTPHGAGTREAVVPARAIPGTSAFDPRPVADTDDASMPVAPVLDADTFTLAREAVLPAVRACAADAGDARVSVTVRVDVGEGRIRLSDARSDSDAIAACVRQAVQALELDAPPDQPDGAQEVTLFAGG